MENYMFCAILVKTVLQDETLKGEELGVQDEKSKFFRNTAFIACRGVLPAGISRREEAKAGIGRGTK